MPTPAGRFRNWTGLSFTPDQGVVTPFLGVTNVQHNRRAQVIVGAGDADIAPSHKSVAFTDPQFTVTMEKFAPLRSLPSGTRGMFTATHNDADNEEGTGAMIYMVAHALIGEVTQGGQYRQFGTANVTIETWSPDGRTAPVAITIAT